MKRLIVLFFVLVLALMVVAKPRKFGNPPPNNNVPPATGNNNVPPATGNNNVPPNNATAAGAAGAADTGNNANFNSLSRDGQPSANPCDLPNGIPPATGVQVKTAGGNTCVKAQMGELPDVNHMVSTVILNPQNAQTIPANKAFTVSVRTANLNTGFFDNPDTQYYLFGQQLDKNGFVMGHQHVTIQKIGDPTQPLDAKVFAFFKGLNDISTNNGVLSVDVPNGLPAGNYRLCTMSGSFAHQPVLMPVAQRGAQDDCIRFTAK